MTYNPEILAPVGNMNMLESAVKAGARGVYLGRSLYSARAYASNFNREELEKVIKFCHKRDVRVYTTVNTLFHDDEIENVLNFVIDLYNMDVDGVIIQDLGLLHLIKKHVPNLPIHASTQMNINNYYGAKFLQKLGFKRVVLARETPIQEIRKICQNLDIEVEVFVHGSLCVSCSGQCLMSSYIGNRSGNRGRCAQPCRMDYKLINRDEKEIGSMGYNSFLSPKDLCTIDQVDELLDAGVHSFKIEGRMKKPEYVYNVVKTYSEKIYGKDYDENRLKEVALRGYTKGLVFHDFGKDYTELNRQSGKKGLSVAKVVEKKGKVGIKFNLDVSKNDILLLETKKNKNIPYTLKRDYKKGEEVFEKYFYDLKNSSDVIRSSSFKLTEEIENAPLDLNRPIDLKFIGHVGENPIIEVSYEDIFIKKEFENKIMEAKNRPLSEDDIKSSLEKLGNTDYYANKTEIVIDDNIFMPVSALNAMRREVIEELDDKLSNFHNRTLIDHVKLENLKSVYVKDSIVCVNVEYTENSKLKDNPYGDVYTEFIDENLKDKFYKMPRLIFSDGLKELDKRLKNFEFEGFLVNNLGDIQFIREHFQSKKIIGDYGLNVLNIYAYKFLEELGLSRITLSTELNLSEINNILNYVDDKYEIIVHGPLISMTMVHCPFAVIKGCKDSSNCENCNFNDGYLKAKDNEDYRVIRKDGYSELYHSKSLNAYKFLNGLNLRSKGSIRVIDDGSIDELNKIYYEKINGKNKKDYNFNLKDYTFGHFEKGIE